MYICEYCNGKIDVNDKVCPTCGAPITNFVDVDEMNSGVQANSQKINNLEKEIRSLKGMKKVNIWKVLVLAVAAFIAITIIIAVAEDIYENIAYTDEYLVVPEAIEYTLDDVNYSVPMKMSDFLESTDIKFPSEFVVNAGDDEYVTSLDYSVSVHVYNIDDTAKDYTECYIGIITIYLDDLPGKSFELMGITRNTTYKQAVKLIGKASSGFHTSRNKYATWYTKNGWINIDWDNNRIDSITIANYRMLEDGYY